MAHTKAKGTSKLGRDSVAKRLGVKKYGGQRVKKGNIIIRQRGTKYRAGENVMIGNDDTIFSVVDGVVEFRKKTIKNFNNHLVSRQVVSVKAVQEKK